MFQCMFINFVNILEGNGRQIYTHWAKHNEKIKNKKLKSELKTTEQILKNRKIAERKKTRQNKRLRRKKKN